MVLHHTAVRACQGPPDALADVLSVSCPCPRVVESSVKDRVASVTQPDSPVDRIGVVFQMGDNITRDFPLYQTCFTFPDANQHPVFESRLLDSAPTFLIFWCKPVIVSARHTVMVAQITGESSKHICCTFPVLRNATLSTQLP